jgi:hypothetical protein
MPSVMEVDEEIVRLGATMVMAIVVALEIAPDVPVTVIV